LQVDHVLGNVTFVQTFFSAQEEEDCYNWRGLLQFYSRCFEKKFADMTFIYWLWVCSNGIHLVTLRSAAIPGGSLAVPTDLQKEGRSVAHILAKDWKQHPSICTVFVTFCLTTDCWRPSTWLSTSTR
jgi:hypothetical protein